MTKRIFLLSLVLSIVMVVSLTASSICSLCGKPITGQYIKFDDGSKFCLSCSEKYPHCFICGKPDASTVLIDNKRICRKCLAGLDICGGCNRPIIGNYTYFPELKLKLCEKCARTLPRCNLCGRPGKNLIKVGDEYFCRACLNRTPFCHICGEPIKGEYLWFDGDETRKYCRNCVYKYQKCADCGAPVGENSTRLADNRVLCHDCYKSAYFDPQQVSTIKKKVLAAMESILGMKIKHKIRYSLQGRDFINKKSEGISGDLNGLFYCRNDTFEIYVLYGLRQKDLFQVIPHEAAHAWAVENLRADLTLEESEGFAQWTAYHILNRFGYGDFSKTLTEGNSVYAKGLRMMLEIEKNGGFQAVFNHLK